MLDFLAKDESQPNFEAGKIILVNKPLTWSSFHLVKKVRNQLCRKLKLKKFKVGHAGTLDPLATGLMLICTGKATKKIERLQDTMKEYTGIIRLGATTPSHDLETEIDATFDTATITKENIEQIRASFEGKQDQIPPMYSALKVDGKRLFKSARKGKTVEVKARPIYIESFCIEKIEMPDIHFRISCSKGTYIRTIAYDFGKKLANGAHLTKLERTKVGDFSLEDAWNIDELADFIQSREFSEVE